MNIQSNSKKKTYKQNLEIKNYLFDGMDCKGLITGQCCKVKI
jgi:hypothetical protein